MKILKVVDSWFSALMSKREVRWTVRLGVIFLNPYTKIALTLVSFAALWWYERSWIVAIALLVTIYIHEMGHAWAARSIGRKTGGIWLIPFFGGITLADDSDTDNWRLWLVYVMGPLWSSAFALVLFLVHHFFLEEWLLDQFWEPKSLTHRRTPRMEVVELAATWARVVRDVAIFNLLNLLPLPFLDGGRMIGEAILSFGRKAAIVLLTILLVFSGFLLMLLGSKWLIAVSAIALYFFWLRWQEREQYAPMYGAEIAISLFLYLVLVCGLWYIASAMDIELFRWTDRGEWLKRPKRG